MLFTVIFFLNRINILLKWAPINQMDPAYSIASHDPKAISNWRQNDAKTAFSNCQMTPKGAKTTFFDHQTTPKRRRNERQESESSSLIAKRR